MEEIELSFSIMYIYVTLIFVGKLIESIIFGVVLILL